MARLTCPLKLASVRVGMTVLAPFEGKPFKPHCFRFGREGLVAGCARGLRMFAGESEAGAIMGEFLNGFPCRSRMTCRTIAGKLSPVDVVMAGCARRRKSQICPMVHERLIGFDICCLDRFGAVALPAFQLSVFSFQSESGSKPVIVS